MLNIPTELLRTMVAVVDQRSFTKAAQSLGVTQPAVSAQVKRLQFLLGYELFDKSAPGVTLTEKGDLVVTYARRILALNDQILSAIMPGDTTQPLRVGIGGLAAIGAAREPRDDARGACLLDLRRRALDDVRAR